MKIYCRREIEIYNALNSSSFFAFIFRDEKSFACTTQFGEIPCESRSIYNFTFCELELPDFFK